MNKIGFAITRATQGKGSVLTCNAGDWTSHITDIRDYIKLFGTTLGEDRTIPFLTFSEEGCFLGIIRQIVGSVDDYFGGWIYIPRNISVSGEELEGLLNFAKDVLTEDSIHLKAADISAKFAVTYPERYSSPYIASAGERYGVRNPGVISSMTEILEHRYQENYRGFLAIFLTDPVYVANEFKSKFGNFTNRRLDKSLIVIPPTDVSQFGDGTKLLVFNGEKYVHFTSPVRTKEGTPLRMSLKRPPFDSYRFTYNATKDNDVIDLQPLKFEWQVRVSRSKFQVYGDDHKPVVDAIIRIGDEVISGDLLVKESAAHSAEVVVSAVGYKESKLVLDLFKIQENVEINLVRSNANYTREIILAGGKRGRITIDGGGVSQKDCPLAGYIENDKGILTVNRYERFKQRAIGFGGALGLGAVVCLGVWGVNAIINSNGEEKPVAKVEEKKEQKEQVVEQPKDTAVAIKPDTVVAPPKPVVPELSDEAKKALRAEVWVKNRLDAIPELEGLFDALNTYRFDDMVGDGKWAAGIKAAHPEFYKFISEEFPDRKWVNATFLPENSDRSITIANFKKNVLKAAERKKNPQAAPAPAPKKDAPKPAAKKDAPKPAPKKEAPKPATKPKTKPAAK